MSALERELPRNDLFRAAYPAVELRNADSARPSLFGHFSVFNVWTEINSRYEGHFLERFAPGAFKRTFNMKKGFIPPLLEHGQDPSVWKKPLGDVAELCEDAEGAYYEVELYDTHYIREILPAIVSGHYGASFRFSAVHEDFVRNPGISAWNPEGIAERTVLEAAVAEFSIVLFPAYREATAGIRSVTDFYSPDALQQAIDEFRSAQDHIEHVSMFLAERQLRAEGDPEARDADAEAVEEFAQRTAEHDPVEPDPEDEADDELPEAASEPEADEEEPVDPEQAALYTSTTHTTSTSGTSGNINWSTPARTEVTTYKTREQYQERLYKRSYQVLGESIWAVHPGMLEVYLNVMAERRAGYRPTQAEIEERIGQRGTSSTPDTFDDDQMAGNVALIPVVGSIMPHGGAMSNSSSRGCNVEDLQGDFEMALADDNVDAIMFNIDSPGGSVDLIPEFGQKIMDSRGKKPIIAMVNTMAASAAYWIASACDTIYVTPSGEVGSIGVYSCHSDLSAKMEKDGIKKTFVSAGKYKVDGNPYEPLSPEAEADMQSKVDAYYEMFISAVAAGRGVTTKVATATFGQGRMVLAEEAVSLGMADKVLTLEEALKTLDPAAEVPAPEEEDGEDDPTAPDAPTDDEPEAKDDGPESHLGSEARDPGTNDEQKEKSPSWLL